VLCSVELSDRQTKGVLRELTKYGHQRLNTGPLVNKPKILQLEGSRKKLCQLQHIYESH